MITTYIAAIVLTLCVIYYWVFAIKEIKRLTKARQRLRETVEMLENRSE